MSESTKKYDHLHPCSLPMCIRGWAPGPETDASPSDELSAVTEPEPKGGTLQVVRCMIRSSFTRIDSTIDSILFEGSVW